MPVVPGSVSATHAHMVPKVMDRMPRNSPAPDVPSSHSARPPPPHSSTAMMAADRRRRLPSRKYSLLAALWASSTVKSKLIGWILSGVCGAVVYSVSPGSDGPSSSSASAMR